MNRKRSTALEPRLLPTPLPLGGQDHPRHGVDAATEDVATIALRSAIANMPDDMADETLGLLIALEIAKRH